MLILFRNIRICHAQGQIIQGRSECKFAKILIANLVRTTRDRKYRNNYLPLL